MFYMLIALGPHFKFRKDNSDRCRFLNMENGQIEGILSVCISDWGPSTNYPGQYQLAETKDYEVKMMKIICRTLTAVLTKKLLRKFGAVEAKLER